MIERKYLKIYLGLLGCAFTLNSNASSDTPILEPVAPKTVEMYSDYYTSAITIKDTEGKVVGETWNTSARYTKATINDENADPEKEYIITPSSLFLTGWYNYDSNIKVKNKDLPVCIKFWISSETLGFTFDAHATIVNCKTYY